MADEATPITPAPVVAPAPAPVASPEVVQTVLAVEAPAVAPIPEPAPAPVAEPVAAPEKSLLGEALEPKEPAPVEPQKAPEVKETDGGQTEQAPPPKYDPWTLPEGVTLDEARVGEFTNLLAELETSGKATHEVVQQFGQKAVEFHVNEVKNTVERLTDVYQKAWDKQRTDWKEAFLKDPDIGGNRFQTTIDSALTFIRTHGGNEEQQKEFRQLMDTSGLGNHPAVIRLLANAGRAMSEGRPLAAPKPISQQKSKTATMYGGK